MVDTTPLNADKGSNTMWLLWKWPPHLCATFYYWTIHWSWQVKRSSINPSLTTSFHFTFEHHTVLCFLNTTLYFKQHFVVFTLNYINNFKNLLSDIHSLTIKISTKSHSFKYCLPFTKSTIFSFPQGNPPCACIYSKMYDLTIVTH